MSNLPATTIADAKALIQRTAAEHLQADFNDYRSSVLTDGGPEDMRKLVELEIRLIGAEADKKGDGFGNLPVFNFIIHRGDPEGDEPQTVQQVTDVEVLDVTEVQPVQPAPPEEPVAPVTEKKLDLLLSDLEGLFGPEETQ